jgi:hypothetical protein
MFIDAQLVFASSQAVTAAAPSTNVIDLGSNREPGVSDGLQVYLGVNQTATAAGAATVQFQLQGATDSGFTTPIILAQTDAVPVASLSAGYVNYIPVPLTIGVNYRYLRVNFNVGTGPLTAGSFTAEMVKGAQANRAYAAPYQA